MLLISARRLIMLYIYAKFHEIILNGIKVIQYFTFSSKQLLYLINRHIKYTWLVPAFGTNLWNMIDCIDWTRFLYGKLQRGIIPQKMYVEWPLFISAHCLVMLYISTKFCEIISNRIKVIERTRFLYWKLQRGIIPQKYRWSDRF